MGTVRASTIVATLLTASLGAAPARAQNASPHEARYREGNELRARHDDAGALAVFESIWVASREPRARAQIGLAEAALGRWSLAEEHLIEALASAADPWIARNRGVIESTLETVRARLGSLEVVCPSAGAEVWIGERAVGVLPLARPLRVVAGPVRFELRAPGRVRAARTTMVPAGGLAREAVDALPLASEADAHSVAPATPQRPGWTAAAPSSAASSSSGGVLRSPWFWIAIGAVVVGGVTTGIVLGTQSEPERFSGNLSPGSVSVR